MPTWAPARAVAIAMPAGPSAPVNVKPETVVVGCVGKFMSNTSSAIELGSAGFQIVTSGPPVATSSTGDPSGITTDSVYVPGATRIVSAKPATAVA